MRRILLAYDGSAGARRALDRTVAEAREHEARVTVLSVDDVPLDPSVPRNFGTLDDISDREGDAPSPPPDVVAHLREAREQLARAGLDADLTWAAGDPGRLIAETAQQIGADAIVVGEHHHGRLASFFGADIDTEVQRRAGCDVILA